MVCQPLRLALLIGAITAVAVSPVRANFRAPRCCDNPCGPSAPGATAPAFRTVTCTEWVRENVPVTRTVYRMECKTETYDTWRCERVPVVKEVSVKKQVPVWTEELRKVCHKETVYEERMVNKTCHKYVQETVMKKQLVRLGHWECREVNGLFGGSGAFGGHGHHGCCDKGCGDACGSASACNDCCRPTRTRKVWVGCPEYKCCPTTVCKKVCVNECVKCKVAVCRNVWKEEKCKVCKMTCVEEKCKVTVCETRKVKCTATRQVRCCVPHQETVNCCKWVKKTVTRQVPCSNACNNACSNACSTSCSNACCERVRLRDRLRRNGDCCGHERSCGSCCK